MKRIFLVILRAYKSAISPLIPSSCRFHPSCSDYAYQAVEKYGVGKGMFLGLKRILKCHPFHPGGYDPLI